MTDRVKVCAMAAALGALVGCGGSDDAPAAPDMLWIAQADTDFNIHLVDEKPFPF